MINWIKRKIKWILITFGILGVAFASTLIPAEQTEPVGVVATSTPQTIEERIQGKTSSERKTIIGQEIAKVDFTGEYIDIIRGIKIDIIEINPIENGIEIFAKGWKNGKQLGFGDGSVEIERFLIYDPPYLTEDPNGDIYREWIDRDTGELKSMWLREDPTKQIRALLVDNMSMETVARTDTQIIKGKIGNTVSTFFSVTGANSPVDGEAGLESAVSWATLRATATGNFSTSVSLTVIVGVENDGSGDFLSRGIMLFDTSSLTGQQVDSATFSLMPFNVESDPNGAFTIAIVDSTPASNAAVVNADYDQVGNDLDNPTEGATRIVHADFTNDVYKVFTLNANGEGFIIVGGISKFGLREGSYDIDGADPTAGRSAIRFNSRDNASGTAKAPKLVVTHSDAPAEVVTIPQSIIWFK